MKERLKKIALHNWIFVFMVLVIHLKSILLLSMLRTPGSSGINFAIRYFGDPVIIVHWAIITLIFSIIFLFKDINKTRAAIIIDAIITIIFIADIWYYRSNGTFLSIRHMLHPEIFNPIGGHLFNFKIVDLLFCVDFVFLFVLFKLTKLKECKENIKIALRLLKFGVVFVVSAIIIGWNHYNVDILGNRPSQSLFRLSWAPFQTFSDMSPLGYHGYDLMYFMDKQKDLSSQDISDIKEWINNNKEDIPDNKYKGMLKGKNVIAIQVESLENFVINKKVDGQEITPNLNKLLNNSLYFDNIYEQNNSGTSSDADLLVHTSTFPIRTNSTFLSYPWTSYNTLQNVLSKDGYTTISSHAELPGSWNWAEPHKSFGADKLWDISCFNKDEVIGPGLSDESYLRQMAEKLKSEKTPFYAFVATVTSHGPFDMPENKKYLKLPKELDENMLGAYFQSIRYTDEAIGLFVNKLKEEGLLDNTVLMIYGDHGGIHKFYEDKIQDAPLEGDWWKNNDKKIPFIIYNPSLQKEVISKPGGQVDFMPTIAYLLGIDRKEFDNTAMGRVLVNTDRDATILNNGEIMGTVKNKKEEEHLKSTFKIADLIIEGNYFKKE